MSNLKSNTASLEALLEQANALPEEKTIQSSKTVTPTTSSQTVKPDSGYDGIGQVVVNAMPTATQATPSVSIDSAGKITATATQSAGYVAAGTKTGTKQLTTQAAKTITPTKSSQTAVAKNVYTTGAVTVAAIPSKYQDVSGVTATAATTLTGSKFVNSSGALTSGTMPNNGSTSKTIDGLETKSATIPAGYTTGGTIRLDSTIDNTANSQADLIAQISEALEGKAVGGGSSGGGGNVETYNVSISTDGPTLGTHTVTYVNASGEIVQESKTGMQLMTGFTLTALVNTAIVIASSQIDANVTGGVLKVHSTCFYVTGGGTITLLM